MSKRNYSVLDGFISTIDEHIGTFFIQPKQTERAYPAENVEHSVLAESERRQSEGFMRVNHAGEVSAQALYKAQAMEKFYLSIPICYYPNQDLIGNIH